MKTGQIGNQDEFSIDYSFFDDSHSTELSLYVEGKNILAFTRNGEHLTTRWNLDELAEWMRSFLDTMTEDPFPVEAEGRFAAEKDIKARDYDTDDDAAFDLYYDTLDEWVWRHTWHQASGGAILADLYFQQIGNTVEISWNNQDCEKDVIFDCALGGAVISKPVFVDVINRFLRAYALHWFS